MTFFSVLLALIAEQYIPVGSDHWTRRLCTWWLKTISRFSDTGEESAARLALFLLLLPPVLIVLTVHLILIFTQPLLALVWNVLIVYWFLGFRQFSHPYTVIQEHLVNRDLNSARKELASWAGPAWATDTMTESELVRHTLERAIIASHCNVFGVFFWFLMPIGPAGVVFYRLVLFAEDQWRSGVSLKLFEAIKRLRYWLDWLPVRLTAIGFAIVGNFEAAAYAWRFHQKKWANESEAILLGAGGGALGVRLGEPLAEADSREALRLAELGESPIHEVGAEPHRSHLGAAVSLVWRAVVLWMILLAMLTIAVWV
jgi:adenosylcobinamide-phosphate synthase